MALDANVRVTGVAFDTLLEQVRSSLRRQISQRWAPAGQIEVLTLDSMIEDAVSAIDRTAGRAMVLALEPDIAADIIGAVRIATAAVAAPQVILTSGEVRRPLRILLEAELPGVTVLAPHELSAGTLIQATGRIFGVGLNCAVCLPDVRKPPWAKLANYVKNTPLWLPVFLLVSILGTTNSAVSYVDTQAGDARVRVFEVPQFGRAWGRSRSSAIAVFGVSRD